jgi:hypothetical protein
VQLVGWPTSLLNSIGRLHATVEHDRKDKMHTSLAATDVSRPLVYHRKRRVGESTGAHVVA